MEVETDGSRMFLRMLAMQKGWRMGDAWSTLQGDEPQTLRFTG